MCDHVVLDCKEDSFPKRSRFHMRKLRQPDTMCPRIDSWDTDIDPSWDQYQYLGSCPDTNIDPILVYILQFAVSQFAKDVNPNGISSLTL